MEITQPKDFNHYKSRLAKSLHEVLLKDCDPPPDELHIPYNLITEDKDTPWHAFARVTYIVFCPTKKTHTVNIHFKYDRFGKFIQETMTYV